MNFFFLLVLAVPVLVILAAIVNTSLRPASEGRPKGFPWIALLFGIGVIAGVAAVLFLLRGHDELVIRVSGPAGARFIGQVSVDGKLHDIEGAAPDDYEFEGRTLEAVIVAVKPDEAHPLEVVFGGDFTGFALSNPHGVEFYSFKKLLSAAAGIDAVSAGEWQGWIDQLAPADELQDPLLPGAAADSNP